MKVEKFIMKTAKGNGRILKFIGQVTGRLLGGKAALSLLGFELSAAE